MQNETELRSDCLKYLNALHGVVAWPITVKSIKGRRSKMKGLPDIICCFRGRFIGIECKIGNNKQSPEQLEKEYEIKVKGLGVYLLCRSVDELINGLTQLET